jgi:hypothetical protein
MEKEFNFNNELSGKLPVVITARNKPGMHDENRHFLFPGDVQMRGSNASGFSWSYGYPKPGCDYRIVLLLIYNVNISC